MGNCYFKNILLTYPEINGKRNKSCFLYQLDKVRSRANMECISKDQFLKFHPDTMDFLRNKYNFGKPGEMDQAVNLIQDWVTKQRHFLKKIFSRPYLERQIILNKGSVERAKSQLDKICTLRTLLPHFFDKCDAKNDLKTLKGYSPQTILKNMTDDHNRVYISKFAADGKHSAKMYFVTYLYAVLINEYVKANDYCDGIVIIADFRGVNIVDFATAININEMRQMATIAIDGYSTRMKQIFIISESKVIDLLIKIFKQVVSSKIGSRIQVCKTVDELYQYMPRKILSADLGGDEKTMDELHDEFIEELSKPENVKYFKEMKRAGTDESLRSTATFNEQYLGIAGTFRTLNVD